MAAPTAERTNPFMTKTTGQPSTKSRAKANQAAERTDKSVKATLGEHPLVTSDGRFLVEVTLGSGELIPNGQFANVSVGPAAIRTVIDPSDPDPFDDEWKANVAKAMNELAELVAVDVIGVQRALTLQSMQEQLKAEQSK